MKKLEILLVLLILIVTFTLRLYKLNNPIADWHSWRQTDTAAVARNFVKDRFNILYPQSDSLTALNEYNLANPNRYFINEFPLYNTIVAMGYEFFGINPAVGRLVSIFFATAGTLFLYLLAKKLFGLKIAMVAAFFYATNPYNIYYGRVIMPDPAYIAFSIVSIYLFIKWTETKNIFLSIASGISLALAILLKPYALFLFIPIAFWITASQPKTILQNKHLYLFLFLSLFPFFLWRLHVAAHPEGTFATTWLYNAGGIRFTGAFFRWLVFERMNRLIFATGGFTLFVLGTAKSSATKNGLFILVWLCAVLVYMAIFAKGNVTHDYYQLPLMPPGAILVSLGFFAIIGFSRKIHARVINTAIALGLLIVSYAFGIYEVKGFFNINHPEIVTAGQRADQLLPKDALVIVPYDNDPTFLYQTNRHGFVALDRPLEKFLDSGAKYLVSNDLNSPKIVLLEANCKTIEKGSQYVILELSRNCINK